MTHTDLQEFAIVVVRNYVEEAGGLDSKKAFNDALTMIISIAASGLSDRYGAHECGLILGRIAHHMAEREAVHQAKTEPKQ